MQWGQQPVFLQQLPCTYYRYCNPSLMTFQVLCSLSYIRQKAVMVDQSPFSLSRRLHDQLCFFRGVFLSHCNCLSVSHNCFSCWRLSRLRSMLFTDWQHDNFASSSLIFLYAALLSRLTCLRPLACCLLDDIHPDVDGVERPVHTLLLSGISQCECAVFCLAARSFHLLRHSLRFRRFCLSDKSATSFTLPVRTLWCHLKHSLAFVSASSAGYAAILALRCACRSAAVWAALSHLQSLKTAAIYTPPNLHNYIQNHCISCLTTLIIKEAACIQNNTTL